jgi:NADH-quinone oxidoreductase E subunit
MSGVPKASSSGQPRAWSPDQLVQIEQILSRYPTKKAAVMPLLWLAQETWGWIDLESMRLIARTLELPPSHVHSVASFYTMFKKQATGKYFIQVCHTLSCALVGANKIIAHLEKTLQVDEHGNSADGLFTILRVECLAACGSAPMAQINDDFYERLTPESVDQIIAAFRAGKVPPQPYVSEWVHPVAGARA